MAGARILLIYYSQSGTTRRIAESIAARLSCDVEDLVLIHGGGGFLRSVVQALWRRPAAIAPAKKDPQSYDLVVIGTPVWAWSVSSPVRAYLMAQRSCLPALAFFCTMGSRGSKGAFTAMEALAGKAPLARCAVTAPDVASGRYPPAITEFVETLEQSLRSRGGRMRERAR
jgi:flavodoxin